jgi:HEAT repeat protein
MFPRRGPAAVLIVLWIAVSISSARGEENKPEQNSAPTLAELLKQLGLPDSSANLQQRRDAARQLSEIKPLPAEAIDPLTKALDTWDRGGVQRYAGVALAGAGARAVPALAVECGQSGRDGEGCQAAIRVLGQIARTEPAAWPVLIDDFGSRFGGGAAVALGRVGAPVVPLLRQALRSANPESRAMAAKALSDIGPPAKDAVPDLVALLNDTAGHSQAASGEWPSPVVQYEAAIALANIDPTRKEALPVLQEAVANRWMTGIDAIKAVEKMGGNGRAAVPALERVLAGGPDNLNRSFAVDALGAIEGCGAGPALAHVLKNDKDHTVRFHAARALAGLGPDCPETIPALVDALGDDEVDSASELTRLGKPGLAALTPALRNPDADVRKSVVDALSSLALKAPWVGKGEEATRSLPDDLVQPLLVAMNDKSITIREQAARALQFAGGEPGRLAAAELDREREIYARQSALDKTRTPGRKLPRRYRPTRITSIR